MTNERIIEVEVTPEDLDEMRAKGISEEDLPSLGIKRYRPARHIIKDKSKVMIFLDADIVDHFKKRDEKSYQTHINRELRRIIECENSESYK